MRESFLHFIWQFQKLNRVHLNISGGEALQVYTIGQYNTDAGPDFLNAKLMIGDITWYGHVELHLRSSDWNRHKHQHDKAYDNVVLHVVWDHDLEIENTEGNHIPVLELKDKIQPDLLKKCNALIKSPESMPCEDQFDQIVDIQKWAMLSQTGIMRLMTKSAFIHDLLKANNGSWEETSFQLLAKNFGFKTNEHPFLKLAQILGHKILVKHANQIFQLEALLFGLGGFLVNPVDDYSASLKKEYNYLSKKYELQDKQMIREEWKYLRMRPGNFPTVRLAEFAAFLVDNVKYFDRFIHFNKIDELITCFNNELSPYWKTHYDFGKESSRKRKGMGQSSKDVLIINTVAPLLATYSKSIDSQEYMDKAIDLLQAIKPEKNSIIKHWESLGLKAKDAFDTQSMLTLYNDFCKKKKCLSCKIGVSLINSQ